MQTATRSKGDVFDPDIAFPPASQFNPPTKLPTIRSVVCMVRYYAGVGRGHGSNKAIDEVSKQVYSKYYRDTVYCASVRTIARRVKDLWEEFSEGKKRLQQNEQRKKEGKPKMAAVARYEELVKKMNTLFDVYASEGERRKQVEKEWGVKMGPREYMYYEDQKGERKMECDNGVDPVWYYAHMKKQREKERNAEYLEKRNEEFNFRSLEATTDMLAERGEIPSDEPCQQISSSEEEQVSG